MRLIVFWLLVLAFGNSAAQQPPDAAQLQRSLTRAQGLLQQLSQQKAVLQAENAEAKADQALTAQKLAAEKRKREDLESDLTLAGRDKRSLNARLDATSSRLERVETRLEEVVAKYKALAADHRSLQGEKATLDSDLASTRSALADAQERNESLYQANAELLEKMMKRSDWDAFLQREPLTGIKFVELENLEQEYRFINEDGRLRGAADTPRTDGAGAP